MAENTTHFQFIELAATPEYCLLCGETDIDDWEAHFREHPHKIIVTTNPRNPDGSWKELAHLAE